MKESYEQDATDDAPGGDYDPATPSSSSQERPPNHNNWEQNVSGHTGWAKTSDATAAFRPTCFIKIL